ncbi:hypothetical protein Hanom_Chr14g01246891 [Helianthus anomalus]
MVTEAASSATRAATTAAAATPLQAVRPWLQVHRASLLAAIFPSEVTTLNKYSFILSHIYRLNVCLIIAYLIASVLN